MENKPQRNQQNIIFNIVNELWLKNTALIYRFVDDFFFFVEFKFYHLRASFSLFFVTYTQIKEQKKNKTRYFIVLFSPLVSMSETVQSSVSLNLSFPFCYMSSVVWWRARVKWSKNKSRKWFTGQSFAMWFIIWSHIVKSAKFHLNRNRVPCPSLLIVFSVCLMPNINIPLFVWLIWTVNIVNCYPRASSRLLGRSFKSLCMGGSSMTSCFSHSLTNGTACTVSQQMKKKACTVEF